MGNTNPATMIYFNQAKRMIIEVDPILGLKFEELKFSCVNRCGNHGYDHCSCDEACAVYNTCCEDFEKDCPGVYKEGIKKYQELAQLDLHCTPYDVLMVASCPNTTQFETHLVRENGHGLNIKEVSLSTIDMFHTILGNRPVTNLDTGIVFTNKNIYDCNNNKNSNFTLWQPSFADIPLNFSFMREGKRFLDFIAYQAPYRYEDLTFCSNKAVMSCNDTNMVLPSEEHNFLAKKCTSFRSYVKIAYQITEHTFYQNRFCLVCNEGYGDFKLFFNMHHTARFQVLFQMEANSTIRLTAKNIPLNQVWSEATCKLDDLKIMTDVRDLQNTSCTIEKCSLGFFQSPDNKCHRLWLIGMVDIVGSSVWWEHKYLNVSDVFACLLKEFLHFKIYKSLNNLYIYDDKLEKEIVLELIQVYTLKDAMNYDVNQREPDINKKIKINLVSISAVIRKYQNDSAITNAFIYNDWFSQTQTFEKNVDLISENNYLNGMFVFNTSVTVCIMNDVFRQRRHLCTPRTEHNIQAEVEGLEQLFQSKCLATNNSRGLELITYKIVSIFLVFFTGAMFE